LWPKHFLLLEKVNTMGITNILSYFIMAFLLTAPMKFGIVSNAIATNNTPIETFEELLLSGDQVYVIDSVLQRRLKRNGFRGTALVAYKNQIIMQYAHGYADYRSKQKISLESSFQLASVSKSFTAASIMLLKERGLLDFNDNVLKYIPEFPYDNITIKELLQHTSGLQNYMYLVDNYWKNDSLITNEDVLDLIVKYNLPLNNRPGRRFLYSNTGYAMLALIVERVSKQPFSSFVKENIFEPVGMYHTFTFNRAIFDTISPKVVGYKRRGGRLYRYNYEPNDMVLGDKSVYSSVNDLFLYQKALNSFQIVRKEILEEAYTKGKTSRYNRSFNYGYGWRLKQDHDKDLVYHNGLWHGFSSTLTRDMNSDITVILLNNTTASISSIKMDLLDIAKKELSTMLISQDNNTKMANSPSIISEPGS